MRDRELLADAVTIVSSVAFIVIAVRLIAGPDALRRVAMGAARSTEAFCQGQAEMWARLADSSARAYDKARSVSV